MSFLHNLYAKVIPDGHPRRKDSYVSDVSDSTVYEDFESDDGFVVYTELKTSSTPCLKSNTQTYDGQRKLEYNGLQNSAPGYPGAYYNNQAGSSLQTTYSYDAKVNYHSRGPKEQTASTFITASDVPLKLSKHLEMIYNTNKSIHNFNPRAVDIGEFFYDFHLETAVLKSCEGST